VTEHVRLDDVVKFLDDRLEVSKFDEVELRSRRTSRASTAIISRATSDRAATSLSRLIRPL